MLHQHRLAKLEFTIRRNRHANKRECCFQLLQLAQTGQQLVGFLAAFNSCEQAHTVTQQHNKQEHEPQVRTCCRTLNNACSHAANNSVALARDAEVSGADSLIRTASDLCPQQWPPAGEAAEHLLLQQVLQNLHPPRSVKRQAMHRYRKRGQLNSV